MHVKTSGWNASNCHDLPKKQNPTSTQHNYLLFACSEDVKLSYQRQNVFQFGADENNRNCGYNQSFTKQMTHVFTFHLSDDNEIFRGYTTMIELYNALKLIIMLFYIQKTFYLGVAFLISVSI